MTANPLVLSHFDPGTGIARITLNRPDALNAIDRVMAADFLGAVRGAVERDGLRCIVIEGAGRAFAAGGDVKSFGGPDGPAAEIDAILEPMHAAVLMLRDCAAPVVTAVQGVAAGAGFALALCGDFVLVAEGARFSVAYTRLGGTPDCGLTWSLARRIGPARALELLLDDPLIDAATAREMGLVSAVYPDETFAASVAERVSRLAAGPTLAFAACRALLAEQGTFAEQLERERAAFVAAAGTQDFGEGLAAFLARRKPDFSGT
ncbi:enoyl-CoA hydratase-related protein [Oricola sp.]|uniref:enoyl-CoA hydratase/isomerase family protein n=1 Tax=Oricola sp. TaxID=1979950 RepID=UPI0025FD0C34|nr:enoyl-CoA hydratase-related protein [Oricola sp.]MCI5076076.1 enoyl-CoA hydratase-related protein [Oricola sp.]